MKRNPIPPVSLTPAERAQICEVLDRRSNEIASFKSDLEQRLVAAGSEIRIHALPGSVELALSREIERLRGFSRKLKAPDAETDEIE